MAYIIKNNDGSVLLTLADSQIDQATTSLDLVGRNFDRYGEYLNNNLIKLLTNFASTTGNVPRSPQIGQLWYNKTSNKLTVFNGVDFVSAYGTHVAGTQPLTTSTGDLWYDTVNSQLRIWDGYTYKLVAPQVSGIYGKVGFDIPPSTILSEGTNIPQKVSILYSYGKPAGFVTTNSFLMSTSSSITYLGATSATNVVAGVTLFDDLEVKGDLYVDGDTITSINNISNVLNFGAIGDGIADDTAAIQSVINSGKNVFLPAGKIFKITSNLTNFSNFQQFGGPGILKFIGNTGIVVSGGTVGVELDLTFNSASHTGTAVTINNANRVRIKRLHGIDVYNVLYVTKANTVTLDWCWATARGKGITWYGNDTARSDILYINFAVIAPASSEYGLDWDGNCHSLEIKYLGLVGGKGTVIRNTSGVSTFPAIGKFGHIEQDYSTGVGIDIQAGLDYDFNMPYVLGSAGDGIKIAATINSYEVRIHGGKSIGNTGYGINNLGGVVLYGASTALYSNTSGATNGPVWTVSPRFAVDDNAYFTTSGNNPLIGFDTNDYFGYDRTSNVGNFIINGQGTLGVGPNSILAYKPISLPVYTFATLPASPQNGWLAVITDCSTSTYNAIAAGGGSNTIKVCYLGGAWRVA